MFHTRFVSVHAHRFVSIDATISTQREGCKKNETVFKGEMKHYCHTPKRAETKKFFNPRDTFQAAD